MRLIPRRKRTWLLVLLGVVIVETGALWWFATAKRDFERRFDKIQIGMTIQEARDSLDPDCLVVETKWAEGSRYEWAHNGERAIVTFDGQRVVAKEFEALSPRDRLRRLWIYCFMFDPPF